jgi:hypothetical protein
MKLIIKALLISLCFCLFTTVPSWSVDLKEAMEDNIIEACEAKHTETGEIYYCILSQLYAFNNVIYLYYENRNNPQHLDVFDNIWNNSYDEEYGVYDFVVIERGIRTYLKVMEE